MILYNDTETFVCEWLRNLIDAGHLPAGEVVETPIQELDPASIPDTFHTFAGIGGWAYALRMAGWPDDRQVWTGSCPCQPFSSAGKQKGTDDERHLWPAFRELIAERRPPVVFGEQVYHKRWRSIVKSELAGIGYESEWRMLQASDFGAWHRRRRWYFVAHPKRHKQRRQESCRGPARRVGRIVQPVSWDEPWQSALSRFRALDDGIPRCVAGTDAARNAIVPQVAAAFVRAYMETVNRTEAANGVQRG